MLLNPDAAAKLLEAHCLEFAERYSDHHPVISDHAHHLATVIQIETDPDPHL